MAGGLDGKEISVRYYNYVRYGFNVNKVGQYAIINGARSNPALNQGIKGTRYAFKNADVFLPMLIRLQQAKKL